MRPAPPRSLRVLLLPAVLAALSPMPAVRAEPAAKPTATPQDLRAVERARAVELTAQKDAAARAAAATAEEQRFARARIEAAETLRITEVATADAAARMETLAARRRDAEARLAKRAEAMQPLLPLIERLSLYPAETLLAVPATPEDRLRALVVLQGLSRRVEIEAAALRRDRADIDAASAALASEAPHLASALAAQAERAAGLDRLIEGAREKRQQAESAGDAAAKRGAAEASRAETLRAALAALEAERKAEEARAHEDAIRAEKQKRAADAEAAHAREAALAHPPASLSSGGAGKGQLAAPVAGRVIRSYGDPTEAGPATGLSYQAPPNARVVAPCSGRVAFADKFRTYGQLLIVDCGGGYHAVLSGLERLDARVGQSVQAGEPLGVMPHWEPGGSGRHPALYMELRRDGQPVDPAAWLRSKG